MLRPQLKSKLKVPLNAKFIFPLVVLLWLTLPKL
jgi:hypothetical protein